MRLGLCFVLATALYLAPGPFARAHAILTDSTPANEAIAGDVRLPVELHFNCRIDVKHSRLWLVTPGDENVVLPLVETAPSNILKSDALELQPGAYHLRWQVLSVDGHITRGDVPFRVSR